jgi:hypothetical protein
MQTWLLLFISLAGSAVLTALQVLLSPTAPFWRWTLSIGIGVFFACSAVIFIHRIKSGGEPLIYIGMVAGISLFIVCLVRLYVSPTVAEGISSQKSPPPPLTATATVFPFDMQEGAVADGIKWNKGFGRSSLILENPTDEVIHNLNAIVEPDRPIIRFSVSSPLAECRFGRTDAALKVTVLAQSEKTGEFTAMGSATDDDFSFNTAPSYRLVCGTLPAHARIEATLATVTPISSKDFFTATSPFLQERYDVKLILVDVAYEAYRAKYENQFRLSPVSIGPPPTAGFPPPESGKHTHKPADKKSTPSAPDSTRQKPPSDPAQQQPAAPSVQPLPPSDQAQSYTVSPQPLGSVPATGPVMTNDAKNCPPGYFLINRVGSWNSARSGFYIGCNAKVCIVDAIAVNSGVYGVEIAGCPKD